MIFNSLPFLVFVAIFIPLYFALKGRARLLLALAGSYLFYGWWDWRFLGLLVASFWAAAIYISLKKQDALKQQRKQR